MIAVRDSEVAAEALGVDLARTKTLAFAMSAFYAGTAGGLYSATLNFVAPEGFDLFQMVVHFSMVVVGGLGSVWGAVLGAALLVGVQEALRAFKSAQEIAFGLVLMTAIIFLPDGLISLLRRRVPGWEEPLRRVAPPAAVAPGAPASGDARVMAARPRVAAASGPMLAVRDLAISFGGIRALDGVSLEVAAGEIRGIIGPNGAGKTTLLNVICGFERPARGEVIVAGSPVTGLAASRVAARGLTRTFQTTQLFRGMTVLENVMTGRHLHLRAGVLSAALDRRTVRAEEAEAAAAARRALAFVGMEPFADRVGTELSFGQQRLVEVARALVTEPKVLLLDEPAVGLSVTRVAQFDALLRRIRDERGVTIVHDRARDPARHGRVRPRDRARLRAKDRRGRAGRDPPRPRGDRGLSREGARCSTSGILRSRTGRRRSCATCRSASRRARSWRCSGATAPARRRRSTC